MGKIVSGLAIISILAPQAIAQETNYYNIPTRSQAGDVQVVIEIPAGTNHKIEYDRASNTFPCDQKNGQDRVVQFLPYVGNYGFIPSTLMDRERGGDGDALDVLVLSESVPTKTVMEVEVLGVLQLLDGGEADDKIIAIPANKEARTVQELTPEIKSIIITWFANYKGKDIMQPKGWLDAQAARNVIDKWSK